MATPLDTPILDEQQPKFREVAGKKYFLSDDGKYIDSEGGQLDENNLGTAGEDTPAEVQTPQDTPIGETGGDQRVDTAAGGGQISPTEETVPTDEPTGTNTEQSAAQEQPLIDPHQTHPTLSLIHI